MMTLKFCSEAQFGAVIEFMALALHGTVVGNKVAAHSSTFLFEVRPNELEFTVFVRKLRQGNSEVFETEVMSVLCALHSIGAKSLETSGFSKSISVVDMSTWLQEQIFASLSSDEPIDKRTNLTLRDLQDIWHSLSFSRQPVRFLELDSEFTKLFPCVSIVAGIYKSLRHRSGCEIQLQTRKNCTIVSHSVDAPSPVFDLLQRWKQTSASTCVHDNDRIGIYLANSYRGLDESRWRISKMLGAVPSQHKPRVFAWADESIFAVDEYHITRGGVPLPLVFECRYDDVHLSADRELRFRMEVR